MAEQQRVPADADTHSYASLNKLAIKNCNGSLFSGGLFCFAETTTPSTENRPWRQNVAHRNLQVDVETRRVHGSNF